MANLSKRGWKECKLGDVIELIGGGTPRQQSQIIGMGIFLGYQSWILIQEISTFNLVTA